MTVPAVLRTLDRTVQVPVDATALFVEADSQRLSRIILAVWGTAAPPGQTPDWLARMAQDDPRVQDLLSTQHQRQNGVMLSVDPGSGLDWMAAHRREALVEALILRAGASALLVDPQWRRQVTDVQWLDEALLFRDRREPLSAAREDLLIDVGWQADQLLRAGFGHGLPWVRDLLGVAAYMIGPVGADWSMSLERAFAYRDAGVPPMEARVQEADPATAPTPECLRTLAVLSRAA